MEAQYQVIVDDLKVVVSKANIKNQSRVEKIFQKIVGIFEDPKTPAYLEKGGNIPALNEGYGRDLVKWLRHEDHLDKTVMTYNFDHHLIQSLQASPFFTELSRWIRKRPSEEVPTMGVRFNRYTEDVELMYNPRWSCQWTSEQHKGVIRHEFYHILFKHITTRRRTPHLIDNIAGDLCINSIIKEDGSELPDRLYLPGQRPLPPEYPSFCKNSEEDELIMKSLGDLIEGMPKMLTSDVYFNMMKQWGDQMNKQFGEGCLRPWGLDPTDGDGGILGPGSGHDGWDDIPDDLKDLVGRKIREMTRKAVKKADSESNGWGNIPAEIREAIRASVENRVDWKAILKNFIGNANRGHRTTSYRRINKKYPMIHPGPKRTYLPKILIAIDQSGSVDDESLAAIFGVLGSLAKKVSFTVVHFDFTVDKDSVKEWKRGQKIELNRTRCGGTSFEAVTQFVNAAENSGKWDAVIIATDGECEAPSACKIKRAWLIVPSRKLNFATSELVISMDLNQTATQSNGAVR
jgi:predicted metal-dependent peptidase